MIKYKAINSSQMKHKMRITESLGQKQLDIKLFPSEF